MTQAELYNLINEWATTLISYHKGVILDVSEVHRLQLEVERELTSLFADKAELEKLRITQLVNTNLKIH